VQQFFQLMLKNFIFSRQFNHLKIFTQQRKMPAAVVQLNV